MVTKIPHTIKHESLILGAQGVKQEDIAIMLDISISTVKRMKRRARDYDDVEKGLKKSGPKGKIDHFMEETLVYMILKVPSAYLEEYAIVFEELFGVKLSVPRISQIFAKHGINRKKLQKEAWECNIALRDHWFRKLADFHAFQMVFIDESGINSKLGQRNYGYSKKGQVIHHKITAQRSRNFSLLPALSIDGYFACNLYRGAVDAEQFEAFIHDDVLPFCTPYPGPRSIIVMDNASIHHGEEIHDIIEEKGCKLEFLPPYSPDFNPIEYSFSVIKNVLKGSHQLQGDEEFDQIAEKLKNAVKTWITPEIAANQFRTCRIPL